jgi:hypothetical protein
MGCIENNLDTRANVLEANTLATVRCHGGVT